MPARRRNIMDGNLTVSDPGSAGRRARPKRAGRWFLAALLLLAAPVRAAEQTTTLLVYPGGAEPQTATITHDGVVRLSLSVVPDQAPVELALQPFLDDEGNAIEVTFRTPEGPAASLSLPVGGRRLLDLSVTGAQFGRSYRGELWLRAGEADWEAASLALSLPPARRVAVPSAGAVTLPLDLPRFANRTGTLTIAPARAADDGSTVAVHLGFDGGLAERRTGVAFPAAALPVTVDARDLPPGRPFVTLLTAEADGSAVRTWLELTRQALARTAVPSLEFTAAMAHTDCGILDLFHCRPEPVRVLLSEEQGQELAGVYALGGAPADGAGDRRLILPGRLAVRFAGEAGLLNHAVDPAGTVDPARRVARQGQREVVVAFADQLAAGNYQARLKFGALNADPARFPELVIDLRVKTHWLWAVLALVAGVLGSFVATKGVATYNRRAGTLQRLAALRQNYWLRLDRSGTAPIVGMRAELAKMYEALSRESLVKAFTAQGRVEQELARVLVHLPYVERLSACIAHWRAQQGYVARRARKALRTLTEQLDAVPLDVDPSERVGAKLTEMEEWQNPALLPQHYQMHLLGDVNQLLRDVDEAALGGAGDASLHKALAEVDACVPDARAFAEVSAALDALDANAPGIGHIARIQMALQALTASHEALRSELDAIRRDVLAEPVAGALPGIQQRLRLAFDAARAAASGPRRALTEHLRLAAAENWPDDELFQRIHRELEALPTLDAQTVDSAIGDLAQALKDLSLSPAHVARYLRHAIARDKDALNGLADAVALEKLYATLKVLWEARRDADLTRRLLETYRDTPDPDKLFVVVDDRRWQALQGHLQIVRPAALCPSAESAAAATHAHEEAYRPVTFEVAPDDPRLADNYLFKHGLRYHWRIDFEERTLDPVTSEPRVTQFIPLRCDAVKIEVHAHYPRGGEPITLEPRWMKVGRSGSFRLWNAVTHGELVGVALALVLAVATGLSSQYLEADLLGTFGDYLTLFTWGFVADQARNILQNTALPKAGQN